MSQSQIKILRHEIDKLDKEISALLCQRLACAKQIGTHKKNCQLAVLNSKRESEIIDKLKQSVDSDMQAPIIEIYHTIFKVSKDCQYTND